MEKRWLTPLAGAAAGLIGGLFGGGGGMVLLPLLSLTPLPPRKRYAACVAIIFPVCLLSSAVYLLRGEAPLAAALPYLCGGLIGGYLGGKCYAAVPTRLLRALFTVFLLYAGVRYLL